MQPRASSGSCRLSSIATNVPTRSQNNAALPLVAAIDIGQLIAVTPVNVVADVAKNLVKNIRAGFGLTFGDHQRWVDSNPREVTHNQQTAPESLFEDDFHHLAAELTARFTVAHQIETYQQPAPAHVAHEFVLAFELKQSYK